MIGLGYILEKLQKISPNGPSNHRHEQDDPNLAPTCFQKPSKSFSWFISPPRSSLPRSLAPLPARPPAPSPHRPFARSLPCSLAASLACPLARSLGPRSLTRSLSLRCSLARPLARAPFRSLARPHRSLVRSLAVSFARLLGSLGRSPSQIEICSTFAFFTKPG